MNDERKRRDKKIVVRTGDVAGFFDRAKNVAQRADQGGGFDGKVTLSFEDPQKMFTVLSVSRRRLMQEIMQEPKTINELAGRLHRDRSAITNGCGIAGTDGADYFSTSVKPWPRSPKARQVSGR